MQNRDANIPIGIDCSSQYNKQWQISLTVRMQQRGIEGHREGVQGIVRRLTQSVLECEGVRGTDKNQPGGEYTSLLWDMSFTSSQKVID